MRAIIEPANPDTIAATLLILLPCAYGTPADFQREGFITSIRNHTHDVDVTLVELGLEQLIDHNTLALLQTTIITPAHNAGYSKIVLAGISLGGFMALSYAHHYPKEIDTLCLIAPYLGTRILINEIATAGGIRHWHYNDTEDSDHERAVWHWLKNKGTKNHPEIYLGYGNNDRFITAQQLLTTLLPTSNIKIAAGGHDWPTWKKVWEELLQSEMLTAPQSLY